MYCDLLLNGDLCRFCLSDSDKSAVSLKNHEILVCVDKKLIDLKEILKFLLLNYSYCENLPNLICNECKNIIIKYYSLKKTFLENEKTLTSKSQTIDQHQKLHNLITIVEEFCSHLSDEDSINVLNYNDKIVIEKSAEERLQEDYLLDDTKKERIPKQVIIQTVLEEETANFVQYDNEEYIDDEFPVKCEIVHYPLEAAHPVQYENEQQEILYEEDELKYCVKADATECTDKAASQETEYEIQISDSETLENEEDCDKSSALRAIFENDQPQESKVKVKNKRKHKVIIDNLENGLLAKKFKVSLVDSNVVVQEDDETSSFMCSNCSSIFTNEKAANDHVMKYGKFQFCTLCRCDECSVIFASQKLFQRHKNFHILSKISSIFNYYDCLHCSVSFGNDKDYEKHIECHAENENYLYRFEGKPQLEGCDLFKQNHKDEFVDDDSWICGHCGMRFGLKNELNFHLTLFHANLFCPFDGQSYGKSVAYLIDHMKTKHPEQFGNEEITFSCSHCFEEFGTKNEMREHEKYCDSKKFECSHCSKKFGLERQLKEHLEAVNGNMKYSCEFCEKKFNNKSSLTVHLRIHSKEKPYVCTFAGCNKVFRTNSHRSSHMDAHNETKNFKCQYCDNYFQTRAAKRAHEKSHSYSHICPLCHKDFKQRSHLVRHANIVHKLKCGSANLEAEIDKLDEGRIKF